MRKYDDDFDDIELDDNEIVNRLMREWELEERRKVPGAKRTPARVLRAPPDEEADNEFDDDSGPYDDYEEELDERYDEY